MMRDCVFILADKNMQASFEGFFSRQGFNESLGCGSFSVDPNKDIKVASGMSDPGLYHQAHELLRPFLSTHKHAVVVLDAKWEGSPGTETIREKMTSVIIANGWDAERFVVIVIDPELENWIWQRSPHVANGLGFSSLDDLQADPDLQRAWPEGQYKPSSPKEIMEALLEKRDIPRSSALYKNITSRISVKQCKDSAFLMLKDNLCKWFPPEVSEVDG